MKEKSNETESVCNIFESHKANQKFLFGSINMNMIIERVLTTNSLKRNSVYFAVYIMRTKESKENTLFTVTFEMRHDTQNKNDLTEKLIRLLQDNNCYRNFLLF